MPEMVTRFMWAVNTGPDHPDATPEKAVETIIAPLLQRLGPQLSPAQAEIAAQAVRACLDTADEASDEKHPGWEATLAVLRQIAERGEDG